MYFLKLGLSLFFVSFFLSACGVSEAENSGEQAQSMLQKKETGLANKGIGPIKNVVIKDEIDAVLAEKGKDTYQRKGCVACHKPDEKLIGPAPKGIFEKRTPEWVMNMILNSEEMREKDPDAKKLQEEYDGVPMSYQYVTEEEARAILEYFRTL